MLQWTSSWMLSAMSIERTALFLVENGQPMLPNGFGIDSIRAYAFHLSILESQQLETDERRVPGCRRKIVFESQAPGKTSL